MRTLVISDDRRLRESISRCVASHNVGRIVASIPLSKAQQAVDRYRPNVLIVHTPDESALDSVKALWRRHPGGRTIVIVSNGEPSTKGSSLARSERAGQNHLPEMVPAIVEAVAATHGAANSAQSSEQADEARLAALTAREREILALTAAGHAMKQIASKIHRSYGTVARHRTNIMRKLDLHDRVALTHFAIRVGLFKP